MIDGGPGFTRRLLRWYDRNRRDLPWRTSPRRPGPLDPYHVLVSEAMLQQTQVSTVIPYFNRFIARFPTVADLASANGQHVLRLWQGLGYYSRARNLHSAAAIIVKHLGGQVPSEPSELASLPGVGRYTAGAIASIAFNRRTPVLDGNVARVLCRLDVIEAVPSTASVRRLLWSRAHQILPHRRVGDFNSALMELGAVVCTPRVPQCEACPVRDHCQAYADGKQNQIPLRRKKPPVPIVPCKTYCICSDGRWLIEQRPIRGRWGAMWQFVTIDPEDQHPARMPLTIGPALRIGTISHSLTHRRYVFSVYKVSARIRPLSNQDRPRRWITLFEFDKYPFSNPQLKIAEMLRSPRGTAINGK